MRCVILILGCLLLSISGCVVRGFQQVPDGPTSPPQLRIAAAVARAEAEALDAAAAEQQGTIDNTIALVKDTVEQIVPQGGGIPDALWGLLGLGAGWGLLPTPGQKRREKVAAAEGRLGGVVADRANSQAS